MYSAVESMKAVTPLVSPRLFLVGTVIILIYCYFKVIAYSFWKKRDVPHSSPIVPFGSVTSEFFRKKITLGEFLEKSYKQFKHHAFHGLYVFHNPVLMVTDINLVKQVLIKDFATFSDRGLYCNEKIDPLAAHLFFISGEKWRTLRVKLSPTFTSGKLKKMFPLVAKLSNELIDTLDENSKASNVLDVKEFAARYTTDTIFSLAFGVDSGILKNPDNEFRVISDLALKMPALKTALSFFTPNVMYALRLKAFNPKSSKFFENLFLDMIEKRRASGTGKRNDFLDLLIDLIDNEQTVDGKMMRSSAASGLTKDKISAKMDPMLAAAQSMAFFLAGFETSSSLISYCLYEMSLNPDCQEQLHQEIDEFISTGESFDYDNMKKLEYLDMVFNETARKHPSLPFLNRECNQDYQIPGTSVVIPKGMGVLISVSGIQNDPEYYPNPEKFDPTRFNKENSATRNPITFLAFGEGPRICIGKRLAIVQSKVALFNLFANYKFSICDKTQVPHQYSTETFVHSPKEGIYLRLQKRQDVKIH